MYEGDLSLDQTTGVDLVNHHDRICSIDNRTCPDLGRDKADAATEFIGTLVSKNQRLFLPGFVNKEGGTLQPASRFYKRIQNFILNAVALNRRDGDLCAQAILTRLLLPARSYDRLLRRSLPKMRRLSRQSSRILRKQDSRSAN
jgi:hypothetical protein